jgi:hypothetical protein
MIATSSADVYFINKHQSFNSCFKKECCRSILLRCVDGLSLPAKPLHSSVIMDATTTRRAFRHWDAVFAVPLRCFNVFPVVALSVVDRHRYPSDQRHQFYIANVTMSSGINGDRVVFAVP